MEQSDSGPIGACAGRIRQEMAKVLVGQQRVVEQILAAVLAGGHVLLEGVPGLAKTLLARALARTVGGQFRRIQFTPDLMPSDVMGTEVYRANSGLFEVKQGPIFTDFLLADEINRTPPKTQSALLECMQERTVSIGGTTYPLSSVFTVLATQNPVEYEGTYPLPEAQLDRFMLKVLVGYPELEEERAVLSMYALGQDPMQFEAIGLTTVSSLLELESCRQSLPLIKVEPPLLGYILDIVRSTRASPHLLLGASPRAAIALLNASRALAAIRSKDFLTPDEVKEMAAPALRHRILPTPEAQVEGKAPDAIVAELLAQVKVPR